MIVEHVDEDRVGHAPHVGTKLDDVLHEFAVGKPMVHTALVALGDDPEKACGRPRTWLASLRSPRAKRFADARARVGARRISGELEGPHLEAVALAESLEHVAVARPRVTEAEVLPDHDGARAQHALEQIGDEALRARSAAKAVSKCFTTTSSTPMRRRSWALRSSVVRGGGTARPRTSAGCGSNVSTAMGQPRRAREAERVLEDVLVAAVDAVEVAEGEDTPARRCGSPVDA